MDSLGLFYVRQKYSPTQD